MMRIKFFYVSNRLMFRFHRFFFRNKLGYEDTLIVWGHSLGDSNFYQFKMDWKVETKKIATLFFNVGCHYKEFAVDFLRCFMAKAKPFRWFLNRRYQDIWTILGRGLSTFSSYMTNYDPLCVIHLKNPRKKSSKPRFLLLKILCVIVHHIWRTMIHGATKMLAVLYRGLPKDKFRRLKSFTSTSDTF